MANTKIEWTEKVWNPVTGCTKISPGCDNCYAERMAKRLKGMGQDKYYNGFNVTCHLDALHEPMKWKKPTVIFVCSMGDLFHDAVPFYFIDEVFDMIAKAYHHTYLILTKRPDRMKKYIATTTEFPDEFWPNVWLGVTAENQEQADKRIPILLQIPAGKRFVSVEPMLTAVNLIKYLPCPTCNNYGQVGYSSDTATDCPDCQCDSYYQEMDGGFLNWVIVGGESGPGARPVHPDWVRSLRDQCQGAGVPFLFKQWGEFSPSEDPERYAEYWVTVDGKHGKWDYSDPATEVAFCMNKVGKKKACRMLDGREWNEYP